MPIAPSQQHGTPHPARGFPPSFPIWNTSVSATSAPLLLLLIGLLAIVPGLGTAQTLSYHEAIVGQAACEMIASCDLVVPTIGGQPWLEKPPLAIWLVALGGWINGSVDETIARLPSALAAIVLAFVVARIGSRLINPRAGWLAGAILLTTAWTCMRGRLADVDLLLTALITSTLAAWPDLPTPSQQAGNLSAASPRSPRLWLSSLPFFLLLGTTAWAKGIGFGACLILAILVAQACWDCQLMAFLRRFCHPALLAAVILSGVWPCLVLLRYPQAASLWLDHSLGRVIHSRATSGFAGEPWPAYALEALGQVLPWLPLSIWGLISLARLARQSQPQVQHTQMARFLICWAVVPVLLVSLSRSRNAHYLLPALPAYAIAAAYALDQWLTRGSPRSASSLPPRSIQALFLSIALLIGLAHLTLIPMHPGRGAEWAWYRVAAARTNPREPLFLLYSDWDRLPYPTPFGPMPHDLPIRLFYLARPVQAWYSSPERLQSDPPDAPFQIIARQRDYPALNSIGHVAALSHGPLLKARRSQVHDRAFVLFRVNPRTFVRLPDTNHRTQE